jgi:hypothetical protein
MSGTLMIALQIGRHFRRSIKIIHTKGIPMNKFTYLFALPISLAVTTVTSGCVENQPTQGNTQTASTAPVHMQCQTDNQTGSLVQRNSICVPDDVTGDVQRNTQETFRNFNRTP